MERYNYSIKACLEALGNPELDDISAGDIRGYLASKTYGEQSLSIDIKNLKTFFNWVSREGLRGDNPMDNIANPKCSEPPPKDLSMEEVEKLLAASRSGRNPLLNFRNYAILLTLLDSTMRVSELAGLLREDFDSKGGRLLIRQGKGGRVRQAYIDKKTTVAIVKYEICRTDNLPWLFVDATFDNPLNRDSIRHMMYRMCDRAGLPHYGPHRLRHTAATMMARDGISAWELQQILGHADNRVALRYIHLHADDIKAAHQKHGVVGRFF